MFKEQPLDGFRLTQRGAGFLLELAGRPAADLLPRLTAALERLGFPAPQVETRDAADLRVAGGKPEPFRRA